MKPTPPERADDILGLFQKMAAEKQKGSANSDENDDFIPLEQAVNNGFAHKKPSAPVAELVVDMKKLFSFSNLDTIIQLSHVLEQFYSGQNSLYKNTLNHKYYLVVSKSFHSPEDFNKVCNILSEYGKTEKYTASTEAFFSEHCIEINTGHALRILSRL
jgi:adapter protein MecA 1/2